jgi:predicted restriction endonuclease
VEANRRLNVPKPPNFRFPQQGWLRVDNAVTREWVGTPPLEESATLDLWVENANDLHRSLEELNERMKELTPERVSRVVNQTIRKDTAIVRKLKEASSFKCQFPGCGAEIRTKDGGLYVEVAHIKAVAKGGQSTLGNLLVLCPNHHKEFDQGALAVERQTVYGIVGRLNGRSFEINTLTARPR